MMHLQASERRSLKAKMEEIKKELRLANKAVIEVSNEVIVTTIILKQSRRM